MCKTVFFHYFFFFLSLKLIETFRIVEEYYRIDSDFVVWGPRIQRIQLEWGRNVPRSSTFLFLNVGAPNLGML